jgi:hypothetical protein
MKPLCEGIRSAFDLTDSAPVNIRRISVLLVAGDFAAVAPDALRHVEVESILLMPAQFVRQWNGGPAGRCAACRSTRNHEERIMLAATFQ